MMSSLIQKSVPFFRISAAACSTCFVFSCAAPQLKQFPVVEVPIESEPEKEEIPKKQEPVVETPGGDLPDPQAVNSEFQLDYLLGFENGELVLLGQSAVELTSPVPTARRFGRFALELWVGKELLERARFDVPLLGAGAEETDIIESGLSAQIKVRIPEVLRARAARVVDRKTGETLQLPWPPQVSNHKPPSESAEN